MKQALKTGCYASVAATGWVKPKGRPEPALRVLMYHKVSPAPGNTIAVTPEQFRRQMQLVSSRWTVVTPAHVLAAVREGAALPPRALLLTFDDGYRDNLEHAHPVLEELGLQALIFPAIGFLGGRGRLPHDERLPMDNPTLSWQELEQLRPVFTIGSHGVSHRVLTRLPLKEAVAEIRDSKAELEERLGRPVDFFSYPKGSHGDYSARLEEEVVRVGYACSFTTIPGGNTGGHVRTGTWLRRYNAEPLPDSIFAALVEGSCDAIRLKDSSWGRSLKRRLNTALGTTTG